MATAPAEALEDQGNDNENVVDFEGEARKMGWRPVDEFKGDPTKHVDAETFYHRGKEMLPIVQSQNRALEQKVKSLEKDMKRMAEFANRGEQRGFERAMAEIKAKQEAAVADGDVAAFRELDKDAEKLRKDMAKADPGEDDEDTAAEQRAEEFADWGKANKWYADNPIMQAYADAQAAKLAKSKGGFLSREDLDAVTDKVREKFPDEMAEPKPRQKVPHVDAGGQRVGTRAGKTYNDLPHDARQMCDKWTAAGYMTKEAYVKDYFSEQNQRSAR